MAAETPVLYNVETWVEENQKYFLPPVCNKMMHNTQLKVSLVFLRMRQRSCSPLAITFLVVVVVGRFLKKSIDFGL